MSFGQEWKEWNEESLSSTNEETVEIETQRSNPYESLYICPYPPEDLIRLVVNKKKTENTIKGLFFMLIVDY